MMILATYLRDCGHDSIDKGSDSAGLGAVVELIAEGGGAATGGGMESPLFFIVVIFLLPRNETISHDRLYTSTFHSYLVC
jgi:hypothetical protein